MRKNKAYRGRAGKPQLRHDGCKIVAIGAQAVQPYNGGCGIRSRFDFDSFE
jgi:hypothetical protein